MYWIKIRLIAEIIEKSLESKTLARMFPPPNAKFAAESFGNEVSEGKIRNPFFGHVFPEKHLGKGLDGSSGKTPDVPLPHREGSLKFNLCD